MNWGAKIALSMLTFMAIIVTMVVISLRQDFHLVADDYYRQEIQYQNQIDKMENYLELSGALEIKYTKASSRATVKFPGELTDIKGQITFFRPSDARFDFQLPIELDDTGIQIVDLQNKLPGLWKVKVAWEADGKSFYEEQTLVL